MRNLLKIVSGGALIAAAATPALAQASATASATGTATIIQALTISKGTDLGFGTIVKPGNASTGTVLIGASDGLRTLTGVANANGNTGVSRATFTVLGEPGQVVHVSVPSSFNMTSSSGTLVVTTTSTTGTTSTLAGTLGGATASLVLGVGGSFTLTSAQASGSYSGTFQVSVNYN